MDDSHVIKEIETEHGRYRVRVEVDTDAADLNPRTWDDGQVGVMACVKSSRYAVPQEDAATVNHWTLEDAVLDHRFQVVARWLRIFHGATVVLPLLDERGAVVGEVDDQSDAEDYHGVIFDTPALRGRIGIPADSRAVTAALAAEVREYGAWADGEVYGVVVERSTDSGLSWRDVDARYGLIGHDYAEQEARRVLAEAVEAVKAEHAREMTTCGTCGQSWCGKCTPTHGPRCPFEDDHEEEDDDEAGPPAPHVWCVIGNESIDEVCLFANEADAWAFAERQHAGGDALVVELPVLSGDDALTVIERDASRQGGEG